MTVALPGGGRRIEWHIRPARDEDKAFVMALAPRLAEGFSMPSWRTSDEIVTAEARTLLAALGQPSADASLLIAEQPDGTAAGVVYVQQLIDYFRQRPHAHIAILMVSADVEGHGAGRGLLEAAESWARIRGFDMITLHVFDTNARARAVYERMGYAPEFVRYVKQL